MTIDPSDCSSLFPSEAMQKVLRVVERVAPTAATVLLTGESGTGRELIADLIHIRSGRPRDKILKIICSSLEPLQLAEHYEEAQGGTLILRDVCELPVHTQGTLLSLLDRQEGEAAESPTSGKPTARIVAVTSRKPEEEVKRGALLENFYYRISTISLHLPPLRERREDIMPLAKAFLKRFVPPAGGKNGFTPAAVNLLTGFDWPGNVSQLQNEVQRAVLLGEGDLVDAPHLSISSAPRMNSLPDESPDTNFTLLEDVERQAIVKMLKETGGNKLETAKRLGIGRQTLYNKIKAYGIEV